MISIKYKETRNAFRVDLEGHANSPYSRIGEDGVCSAVSILTSTLATAIANAETAGMLTDKAVIKLGEDGCGFGRISCRVDKKYHATVKLMYESYILGYMLMAKNFPNEVNFLRA